MRPSRLWRALLLRVAPQARRHEIDADLGEELSLRAAEESPRAARRWYRRQVLGFAGARLRRVAMAPSRWISLTDLKVALRLTRRQPVASATAVLALGAAIALAVAAFTLARGFVFPRLPGPDADRLYQLRDDATAAQVQAWMAGARTVTSVGAFEFVTPPLQVSDAPPTPVSGVLITPAALVRLAPPPLLGRHLEVADAQVGAPPVVVLGEFLWQRLLDSDPAVIGRSVRIGGKSHTVVGIMPRGWGFPIMQQAWLPLQLQEMLDEDIRSTGGGATRGLRTWVVLAPGVSPAQAGAELGNLAQAADPVDGARLPVIDVLPYVDGFTEGNGTTVAGLALGLLVAFLCGVSLNVANLLLARCAARGEELSVRSALGAPRGRIVAQLFLEALVLGVAAATLGTLATAAVIEQLRPWMLELPFWFDFDVDPAVIGWAAALAVLAAALAGVLPAMRVTRADSVSGLLRGGSGRLAPVALGKLSATLMALQLAVSLALLTVAGLFGEGLRAYSGDGPTRDESDVLTAVLYRDPAISDSDAEWGSEELYRLRVQLESALAALPGVESAAVSLSLPRTDGNYEMVQLEESPAGTAPLRVQSVLAGPGLFEVLGVTPSAGRTFTSADAVLDAAPVAIVSERFVTTALADVSPLGRRLRALPQGGDPGGWIEIVGVTPDLGLDAGDRTSAGEVYTPLIGTTFMYAALRVGTAPTSLAPALRQAVAGVDEAIRVTDVQSLADVGWESRMLLGVGGVTLGVLGGLALLLSLAGIYALASLAVTSRTREIGIRVALGASSRAVMWTVLRRSFTQLAIGTLAGTALALLLSRALVVLPFAIPGTVSVAIPVLAAAMLGAGLLASWLPARRALRIQPVAALRAE